MTIRIHLGAHKTATTELQQALRRVRDDLAAGGVGFYGPQGLRGERLPLFAALQGDDPEASRKARWRFGRWLRRHRDHVISEENIAGSIFRRGMFGPGNSLYPEIERNIATLRGLLGGAPVELYLSIREPAGFVTSAYGQLLRMGVPADIGDYTRGVRVAELSWTDLAVRLLALPGVTRLVCWRYEDYRGLRAQLLKMLVGPDLAGIVPPARVSNSGISQAAYQQFAEWLMADMDGAIDELMKQACAAHPKRPGVPGMRLLSDDVHDRARAHYAQDVDRLSRLAGVTWLSPGADPA